MATLSYAYADSVVWLEDLADEGHPMTHDLCEMHASKVRVMRGWELNDTRAGGGPADSTAARPAVEGAQPAVGGALRLVGA